MISRRKFLKACFAGAGLTALGGFSLLGRPKLLGAQGRTDTNRPVYLGLNDAQLARRERTLWDMMENCTLCPRRCRVNRMTGRTGACSSAQTFKVASSGPHFGEERILIGRGGSGTIFFSNCNLLCIFCQNWQIAHRGDGRVTTHEGLADMMLSLQRRGCHNINFVTPTHITPHIISALRIAIKGGLNIPLIYNSSGYETLEVLRLLDGIVDIYLPDFKYQDSEFAATITHGAPDYTRHTAAAISEMHRQVGVLRQTDGIATRGLLIRHLVLPDNRAGTDVFVRWVVRQLGADTHVNIMGQYSPQFRARDFPPLHRRPTREEIEQAMRWARDAGLRNFH